MVAVVPDRLPSPGVFLEQDCFFFIWNVTGGVNVAPFPVAIGRLEFYFKAGILLRTCVRFAVVGTADRSVGGGEIFVMDRIGFASSISSILVCANPHPWIRLIPSIPLIRG